MLEGTTRFGTIVETVTGGAKSREPGPCPFCGWGTIVDGGGLFSHRCECNGCGAMSGKCRTWEEAVEAWNMRAEDVRKKYFGEDDNGQH